MKLMKTTCFWLLKSSLLPSLMRLRRLFIGQSCFLGFDIQSFEVYTISRFYIVLVANSDTKECLIQYEIEEVEGKIIECGLCVWCSQSNRVSYLCTQVDKLWYSCKECNTCPYLKQSNMSYAKTSNSQQSMPTVYPQEWIPHKTSTYCALHMIGQYTRVDSTESSRSEVGCHTRVHECGIVLKSDLMVGAQSVSGVFECHQRALNNNYEVHNLQQLQNNML